MNESINKLFSFDSGLYNWEEIAENKHISNSGSQRIIDINSDSSFLTTAISQDTVQSLDHQIEEMILSMLKDIGSLGTNQYTKMLYETRLKLEKILENIENVKVQQSFIDLVELLNENSSLVSLFQSYTNWLQKA